MVVGTLKISLDLHSRSSDKHESSLTLGVASSEQKLAQNDLRYIGG